MQFLASMGISELVEKIASAEAVKRVGIEDLSTSDSPQASPRRPATPPIRASLLSLGSPQYSESESGVTRKRPSPVSPDEATPPLQRSRSVLHAIDNEISSRSSSRELLARQSSILSEAPSSFVGSPVKKKRRMSSIKRL